MSYLQFIREKSNLSFYVPKLFFRFLSHFAAHQNPRKKKSNVFSLYTASLTVRFPTQEVSVSLQSQTSTLKKCLPWIQTVLLRGASIIAPWHQTYFKQAKMLFSEGMGTHPLHPNWCAKPFESPEQRDKIETSTIANRRGRYWGRSPRWHRCLSLLPIPFVLHLVAWIWDRSLSSVPGHRSLIQHLSSSGANFPSCHHESAHSNRCWQFGLQRGEPEKEGRWGGGGHGRERVIAQGAWLSRTHRGSKFPGIPASDLSPSPCTGTSICGEPSLSRGLNSLLPTPSQPFLLPGASSCLDKLLRII